MLLEDFLKFDLKVGTIIDAKINKKAINPAYVLKVDFGIAGVKTTSAQLTKQYTLRDLMGKQIIAVLNFPAKRIAGIKSEVLVLAASNNSNNILLQPDKTVPNGTQIL